VPESLPDELADTTPATKLVYRSLDDEEYQTYDDLLEATDLGRRTVRRATTLLEARDLAERCWVTPHHVAYRLSGGQSDRQNRG